jgi:hypothetical protein
MANFVTNIGKGVITARLLSAAAPLSLFIGWGTGAGDASATDITLSNESLEARGAATMSQFTTETEADTIQAVATMQATGSRAITEAGLFDAATSGNLIMNCSFPVVNLNNGDSIQFTLRIQLV